jgi:enoyl-CoA hydratase
MADEIIFEKQGQIGILKFNRVEVHNAVNENVTELLEKYLNEIQEDEKIKVLILTGEGEKSFVSGSDIKELSKRTTLTGIEASIKRQNLLNEISNLHIPSIAAINGYAFGIGCEIALACTFRFASKNAKLGQLEINLGIIPGAGGTQRLPRLIGKSKALELILTGKIISAEEALKIGLVDKVFEPEELIEKTREFANIITEKSSVAIKYALKAVNEGMEVDINRGLKIESLCLGACYSSEDSKEGLKAFLEKRRPNFKGK